jgi:hypothetical protein
MIRWRYHKQALVLGNGASRKDLDIEEFVGKSSIYGCNQAYKEDIPFEWIVSTDPLAQHDIYRNYEKPCLFLDWNCVPSEIAMDMLRLDAFSEPNLNPYTPHGCVISGEGDKAMYTFLREQTEECQAFCIEPEILPFEMSSGTMAMWDAAERGFDEIYLAGFGDTSHLYSDEWIHLEKWGIERSRLIDMYPHIKWIFL